MMGKMQRDRGAAGERELAAKLKLYTGLDIRRRCRQHPGDSDVLGVDGWAIECKRTATLSLDPWWKQTIDQCREGESPVLMYRKDRHGWRVRCHLVDILERLHLRGWCEPGIVVDMDLDDWCVAVGLWNPRHEAAET